MFLLNLLNELGKSDKMRDFKSIYLFFATRYNKFNSAGARMLGSKYIYHKTLKLLKTHIFLADKVKICHYVRNVIMNVIMLRYESVNH